MVISPDISKIVVPAGAVPIKKNVGYYLAETNRSAEVTTPGGGGDKVTYHPYRDTETAFYKMLSNVFASVTLMKDPADSEVIKRDNLSFVLTPQIATTSKSSSGLTWPPTDFTVALTCDVVDANGKTISTYAVTGEGKAEFSQFKSDFSLSGKLASEDALLKMQEIFLAAPELRK